MKHCHRPNGATLFARIVEPRATRARNSTADAEERLNRGAAKANEVFRIGQVDLSPNKRKTDLDFLQGRGSVARRPPGDYIRDIDVSPVERDCVQHAVQKLSGPPDERATNPVLLPAGGFADEHDSGVRRAIG